MGAVTTTELGDDRMATGHPADTDATSPLPEGPLSQEEITRLIEEHLPDVEALTPRRDAGRPRASGPCRRSTGPPAPSGRRS